MKNKMHTVDIKLLSDQVVYFKGQEVNVHDIVAIEIDGEMNIVNISVATNNKIILKLNR
jgi:hypothetical protein